MSRTHLPGSWRWDSLRRHFRSHAWFRWRGFILGVIAAFVIAGGFAYAHRDRYSDRLAELSRDLIGAENTARLESWYFSLQDRVDRTRYSVFGGDTNPFEADPDQSQFLPLATPTAMAPTAAATKQSPPQATPAPTAIPAPPPLMLPPTQQVSANLEPGEGVWTTEGLAMSTPDDVLMAKTFVRPDQERPYASVGVLLLDHRRIRLHVTGGTDSPGGDLGVAGPGVIPDEDLLTLLVAWNGASVAPTAASACTPTAASTGLSGTASHRWSSPRTAPSASASGAAMCSGATTSSPCARTRPCSSKTAK